MHSRILAMTASLYSLNKMVQNSSLPGIRVVVVVEPVVGDRGEELVMV